MSSDEQQLDPPLEVDESASKDAGAEGSKSDGPVEKKAESLGDDDRGDDQLVIDEPEEKSDVDSEEKEFEPTIDMMMNDFDDERTMEEEENEDDQENDEDELAALEQEQDMPIEELMKLYNYGAPPPALAVGGSSGPSNEKESGSKTNGEKDSDNAKVSDQIEPHKLTGDAHVAAMESSDRDEDDDVDEQTGKRRGSLSPTQPNKKSRSELARFYEAAVEGRALRSQGGGQPDDIEEEDDDDPDDSDFEGRDYSWKKTIMIGPSYQASVPLGLSAYGDTLPYENEDKLLWNPENLGTDEVEDYLTKSQESVQSSTGVGSLPLGAHVRDDEQALFMLLQCNFNKDEALRRKRMNAVPAAETMSLWSEEECRAFELGLRLYGKDFHMIQNQKVRTRSVGELVQFYYLWKKTERHDVFANTTRLEKKKYILHPGTTDYMDRFIDEQDSSRDRSSSPNAYQSLLLGTETKKGLSLHPGAKIQHHSHSDGISNGAGDSMPLSNVSITPPASRDLDGNSSPVRSASQDAIDGVAESANGSSINAPPASTTEPSASNLVPASDDGHSQS